MTSKELFDLPMVGDEYWDGLRRFNYNGPHSPSSVYKSLYDEGKLSIEWVDQWAVSITEKLQNALPLCILSTQGFGSMLVVRVKRDIYIVLGPDQYRKEPGRRG